MGSVANEKLFELKARNDIKLARKKLKGFSIPTAPNVRNEEACEFFQSAARRFRIASKWQDAAECYSKCADLQARMGAVHEAAFYSLEAATCFERQDPAEAIVFMRNAISLYCELGRFGTAANIQVEVAELFESDRNWEEALDAYRQASDYFLGADKARARAYYRPPPLRDYATRATTTPPPPLVLATTPLKCPSPHTANALGAAAPQVLQADMALHEVAMLCGVLERFDAAVPIFERLATNARKDNLRKFNSFDYLLRASLCLLADGEKEALEDKLNDWCEADATFMTSREFLYICDLLEVLQTDPPDLEVFVKHSYNFDNVVPFDAWSLKLLRRIKEAVAERLEDLKKQEERRKVREEREKEKARLEMERRKRMAKLMKLKK